MNKFSLLIQNLLFIGVIGCANQPVQEVKSPPFTDGVEIKIETTSDHQPLIGEEITLEPQPKSINPLSSESKPGLNIIVGPGGYHGFGLVGFFKSLEKKHIKINQISGIEMGGLFAALYAKHRKSSVVEWQIFKLINKLDEEEVMYTAHWYNVLSEFIKKNFENLEFSNLSIKLKLASINKLGYVEWIDNGSVEEALVQSLKIKPENFRNFIWPLKIEGEDWLSLDILTSNAYYKQKTSEPFFKEYIFFMKEIKKQNKQNLNLKFTQGYVDSYKNWQNNVPVAQKIGIEFLKSIEIKLQKSE